jgi:hypothetical protein
VLLQAGTDLYRVASGGGAALKLNPAAHASPVGFSAVGKIVFVAGEDIYAARADGSAVTKLAINRAADQSINEVKLAGEAVAFQSTRDIAQGLADPGVKELLAADLPGLQFTVALPMILR